MSCSCTWKRCAVWVELQWQHLYHVYPCQLMKMSDSINMTDWKETLDKEPPVNDIYVDENSIPN